MEYDNKEENKSKLSWYKWDMKDAKIYKDVFTNEQMGELFFVVMETVDSGEIIEVSSELKLAYMQLCNSVEKARTAYIKKCKQNAENGAKGGKAKAEKSKKAKAEKSKKDKAEKSKKDKADSFNFKPPSETKFRDMAKHICKKYDTDCDEYDIDKCFNTLVSDEWKVFNVSINNYKQLEAVFFANHSTLPQTRKILYALIKCGIDDYDISIIEDIADYYNEETCSFEIDGESYKSPIEAVKAYYRDD